MDANDIEEVEEEIVYYAKIEDDKIQAIEWGIDPQEDHIMCMPDPEMIADINDHRINGVIKYFQLTNNVIEEHVIIINTPPEIDPLIRLTSVEKSVVELEDIVLALNEQGFVMEELIMDLNEQLYEKENNNNG